MPAATGSGPVDLSRALRARELSSRELVASLLERIVALDDELSAWARTYPEPALAQADAADAILAAGGTPPPLCGVPFGVKDVIAVAGLPLTLGRENWVGCRPEADATCWRRLREAGAVLLGHNRSQELALGNAPQLARNPWDRDRSPGGSSNGGAVAVAAGMVPVSLGSDVGGSLRRPASACGLTTVVPSPGAVPLDGLFTFNRAADHVGPLAASAADCALVLAVLARRPGAPLRAASSAPAGGGSDPLAGRRILRVHSSGWPTAAEVEAAVAGFATGLAALGAELEEAEAPPLPEPASLPRREQVAFFRSRPPAASGFSPHVAAFGEAVLRRAEREGVADDRAASASTAGARGDWRRLFERRRLDAVLLPAQLLPTPLLPTPDVGGDLDRFGPASVRSLWNLLGMPVVCLPAGHTGTGMPIGAQLVGMPGDDFKLLAIAHTFQAAFSNSKE